MNVCRVYVHLYVASVLVYLIDLRVTCPVSLKMPRVVCVCICGSAFVFSTFYGV
jgi:hypothetical protein